MSRGTGDHPHSEVRVSHFWEGHDLVEWPFGNDASEIHDHSAVHDFPHHAQVVFDEQHCRAPLGLQRAEHLRQLCGLVDVEARRRLIGHQQDRIANDHAREFDQPAESQPERRDRRVLYLAQTDQFENLVDVPELLGARCAPIAQVLPQPPVAAPCRSATMRCSWTVSSG